MRQEFQHIVQQIGQIIYGKQEQVLLCLTCLFADGHLLIEDLPGIGKTSLAQALAHSLGLQFRRIQFTSDLLPGDIIGVSVYDQRQSSFTFHDGPVFTQVLLTDEINRASPKTQSALLEAMEERQVTIEGVTRTLSQPFFVIATQNPKEQAGTFPLPESQLDRFLMRIRIGYPDSDSEIKLLQRGKAKPDFSSLVTHLTVDDVLASQKAIQDVTASEALLSYVQNLMHFSRNNTLFYSGLSPRAGLGLLTASKSWAYIHGRDFVLPEDVQAMIPWVLGHRLKKKNSLEFDQQEMIDIFQEVPIP